MVAHLVVVAIPHSHNFRSLFEGCTIAGETRSRVRYLSHRSVNIVVNVVVNIVSVYANFTAHSVLETDSLREVAKPAI
jgi:hypothetical protein